MDIEEMDRKKKAENANNKEFEEFLEDIEFDKELRNNMNLYRDEEVIKQKKQEKKGEKVEKKPAKQERPKKQREKAKVATKQAEPEKRPDEVKEESAEHLSVDSDANAIKLEELMMDLKIEDEIQIQKENDDFVDDFIKQIEKIRIEK